MPSKIRFSINNTDNVKNINKYKNIVRKCNPLLLLLLLLLSRFSSVQFSCSVVSDSLWPHESQHARPPCPSSTPRAYSNLCPSSRWCHPAISSSVVPFSFCPQSLPASGSFQWVNSLHEVAKVLEFQFQHQSFQWILMLIIGEMQIKTTMRYHSHRS